MFLQPDFLEDSIPESHILSEIDSIKESHDKVRKRIFAEMSGLKKIISQLQSEVLSLQQSQGIEKSPWQYGKGECLFEEVRSQKITSIFTA